MSELVDLVRHGRIFVLTINSPTNRNAISLDLTRALSSAIRECRDDRGCRVIVLAGSGTSFCAGADLKSSPQPGDIPGTDNMGSLGFTYKMQEYLASLVIDIHECEKPVVAAIQGHCYGIGLSIAAAADVRICASSAKFCAAYIKTGLSACDMGSSYLLPKLMGLSIATEFMMTGRVMLADEALSCGFVSSSVDDEILLSNAMTLAEKISANSEYGVMMTKSCLRTSASSTSLRAAIEMENRQQVLGCFTGCFDEMIAAFAEGRKPTFKDL